MVGPRNDSAGKKASERRATAALLSALAFWAPACTYHPVTVGADIGVVDLSASPSIALANNIDPVNLALHARLADATGASGIPVAFVVETLDANSVRLDAPVTDANGLSSATLLAATAGTRTVTAWLLLGTTWTRLDQTTIVEFLPAAGAVSATASPNTVVADGFASTTLTVLVTNETGQALPNQSVTLATSMPGVSISPDAGFTDADGLLVATISSTATGDATIAVTSPYGATGATVSFTVGPPDAAHSSLQVAAGDGVPADGNSTVMVTAIMRDSRGHAIANAPVRFSSAGSDALLGSRTVVTDEDGNAKTSLRSQYAGTPVIHATLGGLSLQARAHFTARTPWCASGKLLLPRRAGVLTTAARPRDIRVGDMNGDGRNDIIAANLTAPVGPIIFQGVGDGTFLPGVHTPTAISSGPGLWVGDFNSDAKRDVAIASGASQLSLYVGQNSIPIQNGNTYATGLPLGNQVCSGEFNGDGKVDFVVTSSNTPSTTGNPNTLVVMFGDGQGGLVAGPQTRVGSALGECASQDINGDNKNDVVVASAGDHNVYVLFGNDNGTFQSPVAYVTFAGATPIRLQDFNKDGKGDIATAGTGAVGYLAALGGGVFAPAVVYPVAGAQFTGLRNVDFDRDGNQDLVAVDNVGGGLSVLLGRGDGTFSQATTSLLGGVGRDLAPGDLDGDNMPDLATTLEHAGTIGVYLNGNSTSFVGPPTYKAAASYLSRADFNNDGALDVVASGGGSTVTVMLGAGDGNFVVSSLAVSAGVTCARASDITGDGNQDLLVGDGSTGQVTLRAGNGRGGFSAPSATLTAEAGVIDMALADLDGDGALDLVTVNSVANSLSVLLGRGTSFAPATRYTGLASPTGVAIADFDTDGYPDVAVTNTAGATVSLFLGAGDGSLARAADAPVGQDPYFLSAGDFNGDGKPDLAVANHGSTAVSVLLGAGDGSFLPQVSYAVLSAPTSVATTDSNGDGRPDLLVTTSGNPGGSLSVLLGLGDGTFGSPQAFQTGNAVYALPGDFNRDGRQDVAVANAQDSLVTVHLAKGCE
jgi:hypothetical protein